MIAWLHPAGLVAVALIAGPVIVHLLLRRRARRIRVSSVRFITPHTHAAVRIRRPSDPLLLVLRMAIVAAAALAVARPLVIDAARRSAWTERRAVAIVVDTSARIAPERLEEAVRAETAAADVAEVIRAGNLPSGLTRAAAWLRTAPPASRDIVVVSDFRHGALTHVDAAAVGEHSGIRFVQLGEVPPPPEAVELLIARDGLKTRTVRVENESTVVSLGSAAEDAPAGLRVVGGRDEDAEIAALLRVVARAGARAPSDDRAVLVRLRGAPAQQRETAAAAAWTLEAGRRLLHWAAREDVPVTVHGTSDALIVQADVPAGSVEAAEIVRAALDARHDPEELRALEVVRIPRDALDRWTRPPAVPDAEAWRHADESDGRWLWALAIVLMLVEGLVRRSRPLPAAEVRADAA
ncbi:MAG TPA: BatA domain-containing protein [Vicinamibacterales bacterium]|nr:BatA domain-containing protein [Vicinamibacterales bacterium]